jgi:hypothetical protein
MQKTPIWKRLFMECLFICTTVCFAEILIQIMKSGFFSQGIWLWISFWIGDCFDLGLRFGSGSQQPGYQKLKPET